VVAPLEGRSVELEWRSTLIGHDIFSRELVPVAETAGLPRLSHLVPRPRRSDPVKWAYCHADDPTLEILVMDLPVSAVSGSRDWAMS